MTVRSDHPGEDVWKCLSCMRLYKQFSVFTFNTKGKFYQLHQFYCLTVFSVCASKVWLIPTDVALYCLMFYLKEENTCIKLQVVN